MKPLYMELSESDCELLKSLARSTEQSKAQIVRWAVRYYAINGPWTRNRSERQELVGGHDLDVGLDRRCV